MLREAGVQPHHKVLITWGGATACYAVQLAKHVFNASTVAVMADSGEADLGQGMTHYTHARTHTRTLNESICAHPVGTWACLQLLSWVRTSFGLKTVTSLSSMSDLIAITRSQTLGCRVRQSHCAVEDGVSVSAVVSEGQARK